MANPAEHLEMLLTEIVEACKHGYPLVALGMTLALPDICASLASNDGRSTGSLYKAWCAANLPTEQFSFVTPEDLWSMRCGMLHEGRVRDLKNKFSRVLFALPSPVIVANTIIGDAYCYSIVGFCENFCLAVLNWLNDNRQNTNVKANLPRLIHYRADALTPLVSGVMALG